MRTISQMEKDNGQERKLTSRRTDQFTADMREVERWCFEDFVTQRGCFGCGIHRNMHTRDLGHAAKRTSPRTGARRAKRSFGTTRTVRISWVIMTRTGFIMTMVGIF